MSLKIYAARKSYGWFFLALIALPFLLLGGFLVHIYLTTKYTSLLLSIFICLGIALPFLIILISLPSMNYELDDEKLVIKCGLLKYVVPSSSIKRTHKT